MSLEGINADGAPKAIGPYSHAIKAGATVYVSGQLGLDPSTGDLRPDVKSQTEQAIANLEAILESAGLSLRNVVKTTVFLANISDFAAVNEIYASHFTPPYPVRSAIQVAALPKGGLVEIEAIASAL